MKLTNFSIRRPKFTIVAMILFLLVGLISVTNLPLQLTPEIEPPVGAVVTSYPGASPEEVVDNVTQPLEEDLSTLSGLNNISSQTMEGMTLILLEFSWTTTLDDVENDILNQLNQTSLPDGANDPSFLKFDPSMMPMIQMSIAGNEGSIVDFQDDVFDLERDLTRIEGIASIDTAGSIMEEIRVTLSQDELENYTLTQEDVISTIQGHDITLPGGTVIDDDLSLTTRVISTLDSVEELEDVVVTVDFQTGDEITLTDIGEVELTTEDQRMITRTNQEEAMQLSVMKEADSNTVTVSTHFNEELDRFLEQSEYEDLNVEILFDEGEFIQLAINSVYTALIVGGLLAMVVLFLFLRNLKTPLMIGIAIPFSVIVTFALLYFTEFSLNIMTLGGLALGIGMLVDNSIVVIENIYRHLSMGKDAKHAAREGTREVGGAITASTLTTISVFVPVVFISGIVGNLFTEFALTVSFSLLASLAVALTVVPMMASRLLKKPKNGDIEAKRKASSFIQGLESAVRWALGHRFLVLALTALVLVVGVLGLTTVGADFLPDMDEGFFTVEVELEHGTSLERTADAVQAVEDVLDDYDEINNYLSIIGSDEDIAAMGGGSGSHEAQVLIEMVPPDDRQQTTIEFAESIESELERADDEAEIEVVFHAMAGSEPNTLIFSVSDADTALLDDVVQEIEEELEDVSEINDLRTSIEEQAPEIQILVDVDAAREEGFVPAQIADIVNQVTTGEVAAEIETEDQERYEILVQYEEEVLESVDNLEGLLLQNMDGEYVELGDVTTIEEGEGPATINRRDQENAVDFTLVYSSSTTLAEIAAIVEEVIDDIDLEDSTTFSFGGDQEFLNDAMQDLTFAFMLSLLFIFLVLAAQFESFKYPFVIMFTVPLIVIGITIALTLTQTPLSVIAAIGVIVLAGIVVNNAIVLVDYINQKKEQGLSTVEAIVEAVKDRVRPVLMTATTTVLGILPLALGFGEGAEMMQPLGISVIGGLVSSTLLTLFVIPVLYSLFDKQTRHMNRNYVTPEGRLVPAYLIEEDEFQKHYGRKPSEQAYHEPNDVEQSDSGAVENMNQQDSQGQETEEQEPEAPQGREEREEGQESRNQLEPRAQIQDDLSKEDILYLLERIVDSDRKSRNRTAEQEPEEGVDGADKEEIDDGQDGEEKR